MTIKEVTRFLYEVKVELTKVIWPKFDEFIGSTIVVLFLVFVFMVYLGLVDLGFSKLARYIFELYGNY